MFCRGKSLGYGFVQFSTTKDATECVKRSQKGMLCIGLSPRPVRVEMARVPEGKLGAVEEKLWEDIVGRRYIRKEMSEEPRFVDAKSSDGEVT